MQATLWQCHELRKARQAAGLCVSSKSDLEDWRESAADGAQVRRLPSKHPRGGKQIPPFVSTESKINLHRNRLRIDANESFARLYAGLRHEAALDDACKDPTRDVASAADTLAVVRRGRLEEPVAARGPQRPFVLSGCSDGARDRRCERSDRELACAETSTVVGVQSRVRLRWSANRACTCGLGVTTTACVRYASRSACCAGVASATSTRRF